MGSSEMAWGVALLVVVLMMHRLWRSPDPHHEFILNLVEQLLGEKDGNDRKQP
jgi:hypothetical protein